MQTRASKRVGLLGGTFNPVHCGHLTIADDALSAWELDEIWFVPCAIPAHKAGQDIASAADREAMIRVAIEDRPRYQCSTIELARGGISYTVDTLRDLRATYSGIEWFFIIGADTLPDLATWREIEAVLTLCTIVTLCRPGIDVSDREALKQRIGLPEPWPARLVAHVFEGRLMDISSSDVRKRVAEKQSIRYLVPERVEAYIRQNGLYRYG